MSEILLRAVLVNFDGALGAGVTGPRLVLVTGNLGGSHHALHLCLVEVAHGVLHAVVWIVEAVFESVLPRLGVDDNVIAAGLLSAW
jgi:hypothetical protein